MSKRTTEDSRNAAFAHVPKVSIDFVNFRFVTPQRSFIVIVLMNKCLRDYVSGLHACVMRFSWFLYLIRFLLSFQDLCLHIHPLNMNVCKSFL